MFSLRWRVLWSVLLLNAFGFGVGGVLLYRALAGQGQRLVQESTDNLLSSMAATIRPGQINVKHILQWPWESLDDALLIDDSITRTSEGELYVEGIYMNPAGAAARGLEFDEREVLLAIERAMRERRPVEGVAGGRALPIMKGPDVWGGWWYRARSRIDPGQIIRLLSPWFLLSIVLFTGGSFLALRRLVLAPVEQLAEGARRVSSGDYSVRVEEPRRHDELAELVRSFNSMTQRVCDFNVRLADEVQRATHKARQAEAAAMTQRRLAAMGELAAGIAHEINNPLGGLQNAVETLAREDISADKRARYLGLLGRGLERIGETVRRLRRFTPRESSYAPLDVVEIVRDAVDLVRHRAERVGVQLSCEFDPALAQTPLRGSRNELGQAVLNLLANGLDALEEDGTQSSQGPRIDVRVAPARGGLAISVADNGPGVEPSELARVSDLFYTTKQVGKGTGLGLALVHKGVHAQGGKVRITSEQGRYFAVELWLPIHLDDDPGGGSDDAPPAQDARA